MKKAGTEEKEVPYLTALYHKKILSVITKEVLAVRDKIKDDAMDSILSFDETPYIERMLSRIKWGEQTNNVVDNGRLAEFKIRLQVK